MNLLKLFYCVSNRFFWFTNGPQTVPKTLPFSGLPWGRPWGLLGASFATPEPSTVSGLSTCRTRVNHQKQLFRVGMVANSLLSWFSFVSPFRVFEGEGCANASKNKALLCFTTS